jgi:hypothetical protein
MEIVMKSPWNISAAQVPKLCAGGLAAVLLAVMVVIPPAAAQVAVSDDNITITGEDVLTMGHATPLYARGTGMNNPANRVVKVGDAILVGDAPGDQGRGLMLTILDAATHSEVQSSLFDTWGDEDESDLLALALALMNNNQIGILTSSDGFEASITPGLRFEAQRLGLHRLAGQPRSTDPSTWRHPYAAIFYGAYGFTPPPSPNRQAVEIVQPNTAAAPHAILATWLIDDGFVGQALPARRPDPPCFSLTQRFVDCNNGTVTDTQTGLIWLKNANCFEQQNWKAANESAANLSSGSCGLSDGSREGDWRLPTWGEFSRILEAGCAVAPKIAGNGPDAASSCYSEDPWASGVEVSRYWSSETLDPLAAAAGYADFSTGDSTWEYKVQVSYVWPVRGLRGE